VLLYLVKHSRPKISKSVSALSKVADGATEGYFMDLVCTIKYFIDTEELGLLFQPKSNNNVSIWKGYPTVNMPAIQIHISLNMVMSYISEAHPLLSNLRQARV
jgi:hypothetical protein